MIKAVAVNAPPRVRLGLYQNVAQFTLLVVVNAFVGAMVGWSAASCRPSPRRNFIWPRAPPCCPSSWCSAWRRR